MELLTAKFYKPDDDNFAEFIEYLEKFKGSEIVLGLPIDQAGLSDIERDRLSVVGYQLRNSEGNFFSLTIKEKPPKGSPGNPNLLKDPRRID